MIRAAVFDGPGRPFRFEAVPRPQLGPGEALVRVRLCTVCGSDLHTFAGRRHGPTPCVLGHEILGEVEDVGEGFAHAVGERVVVGVAASCGRCFFCERGLPQKCESLVKYGHTSVAADRGPAGGLTTHCHLFRGSAVVRVPDGLPDEVAAPAGCATATVAAALAAGNLTPQPPSLERKGETIRSAGAPPFSGEGLGRGCFLILGLGMLGLTACAMASAAGATTVIACDVNDARRSLARRFGATHTATPAEAVAAAKDLTAGRGADVALELSGSPAAAALSLDVLRTGGTAVWVGAVLPTDPVAVPPEAVVRRCLTVVGVHNYAPWHLRTAIDFLAANHARFPFAELVARTFPLDEADTAFRFAEAARPVRVAVRG